MFVYVFSQISINLCLTTQAMYSPQTKTVTTVVVITTKVFKIQRQSAQTINCIKPAFKLPFTRESHFLAGKETKAAQC